MGYRVVVGGVPVECDTIDEALALAERASGGNTGVARHKPPSQNASPASVSSRWTEARMRDFFARLSNNQRRLVDELLDHADGRTDRQLIDALPGVGEGKALAGVFTGVWKNAKKVGADPNDVYKRQPVQIGDSKQNEYTLSDSFRVVALEARNKPK